MPLFGAQTLAIVRPLVLLSGPQLAEYCFRFCALQSACNEQQVCEADVIGVNLNIINKKKEGLSCQYSLETLVAGKRWLVRWFKGCRISV